MIRLRNVRAVLHRFNPAQEHWQGARIVEKADGVTVETLWKRPWATETESQWYMVEPKCFAQLKLQQLIEAETDSPQGEAVYKLSEKGLERLRKS